MLFSAVLPRRNARIEQTNYVSTALLFVLRPQWSVLLLRNLVFWNTRQEQMKNAIATGDFGGMVSPVGCLMWRYVSIVVLLLNDHQLVHAVAGSQSQGVL